MMQLGRTQTLRQEISWIVPAAVLVAIQQAGYVTLSSVMQIAGAQPFISYGVIALAATSLLFAGLAIDAMRGREPSPLRRVHGYFATRSEQLTVYLIGFTIAWLQMVSLTATKTLIPAFEPMWADPLLADFDRWLLGAEAWALAEFLRPLDTVIDVLYALWSLVLQIVVIAVLLASPSRAKARVAISFFLTMALVGVVGQFVLPSGGPIFWSRLGLGHRFDAMQSAPHSIVAASYLWGKHMGNTVDFATGISAFPSMHVAMAAWMVVATHSLFPRFKFLSWFYFLVILLGSVFLGWHYLVDGIGGAFGMICCWWLAPLFIRVPNAHRNAIANFGESLE